MAAAGGCLHLCMASSCGCQFGRRVENQDSCVHFADVGQRGGDLSAHLKLSSPGVVADEADMRVIAGASA